MPTIDGNFIYSCGYFGHVYCIDKKTHKPIWNKNVWIDFGGVKIPNWGIAQNPLVYNDLLILASQTEKAGVVAYNKLNGEIKWVSKPFPNETGYVSPKVVNIDDEDQIIMVSSSKFIEGKEINTETPIGIVSMDHRQERFSGHTRVGSVAYIFQM